MRKLLLALALVASAGAVPAHAADWVIVGGSDVGTKYVDRTSIRQVGSYKQAWARNDYRDQSDQYERMQVLDHYDCAGRRTRTLQISVYFRNGQTDSAQGGRVWDYVTPGSIDEFAFEYVCFGRRQ